jgi:uncharacterized membrane protein HdeD (DUF308 family)
LPRLDDFLEPLNEGVWEVTIPKESVTVPLDAAWIKSGINVPSPGTIASYRKGQFHVHETKDEWKVHLDRYDPKKHPVMHLLDDAPLLLMIGDTFITLISDMRRDKSKDTKEILETQDKEWHLQFIAGIFLILIGFDIALDPLGAFLGAMSLIFPLAIVILGILVMAGRLWNAGGEEPFIEGNIFRGLVIIAAGVCAFSIPPDFWILLFTAILAVWMFASAIILLRRVKKGRSAVPEGFFSRLAIGILSLLIVIGAFFTPYSLVTILTLVVGLLLILIGIMLVVNGLRLRRMMKNPVAA